MLLLHVTYSKYLSNLPKLCVTTAAAADADSVGNPPNQQPDYHNPAPQSLKPSVLEQSTRQGCLSGFFFFKVFYWCAGLSQGIRWKDAAQRELKWLQMNRDGLYMMKMMMMMMYSSSIFRQPSMIPPCADVTWILLWS